MVPRLGEGHIKNNGTRSYLEDGTVFPVASRSRAEEKDFPPLLRLSAETGKTSVEASRVMVKAWTHKYLFMSCMF